jgi:hypothetical protein
MNMDELDNLIIDLPVQDPKGEMPERIRQNFRQRIKRRRRLQILISSSMLVIGAMLSGPGLLTLGGQISLPSNSLGLIDYLLTSLQDLQYFFDQSWNGIIAFQGNLASSLSITSEIGMVVLGLGILFSISFLIPHKYS